MTERIGKLEKRLEDTDALGRLSEGIARLKERPAEILSADVTNPHEEKIGTFEERFDGLERRMGEMEETAGFVLADIKKKQDLSMRRGEIVDFMLKKYETVQNIMAQNEKKIVTLLESKSGETRRRIHSKLEETTEKLGTSGKSSEGLRERVEADAANLEKHDSEMIQFMAMLNEQSAQMQNLDWMHDEIMSIKTREMQIINLLKDEASANVETEFLDKIDAEQTPP